MKLKILEHEKDKIRLIIEGQGHTFVNALVDELLLDDSVDVAKYIIEFQFSDPEVLITMKPKSRKTAEKALLDATKKISKKCDDLLSSLKN